MLPYSAIPSRFPNGLNNCSEGQSMEDWKSLDESKFHNWLRDFDSYAAGDWVVTVVGTTPTAAQTTGDGGWLLLTTTAGSGDGIQLQWAGGAGSVIPSFSYDTTKDMVVKTKFKVDDATLSAFLIGMAIADTTLIASLPTSGFYLYKASGATSLIASTRAAATSTSITAAAMADDTFVDVALVYLAAIQSWGVYVNNAFVGSSAVLTNMPTALLAPSIALRAGSAAIRTATVDYLWCAKQR